MVNLAHKLGLNIQNLSPLLQTESFPATLIHPTSGCPTVKLFPEAPTTVPPLSYRVFAPLESLKE